MIIRKIELEKINPAPYNPRIDLIDKDAELQKLENSINKFGYVEPIVWNESTGTLVSGHQRFKILKKQGLKKIEVSVVNLSIEKEKALNLALNKIRGRWDNNKLAELLFELKELPDFDVNLSGFDNVEISKILDNFYITNNDYSFDFEATLNSIETPITKLGDIITLGNHKILCGDCSSSDNLNKLLENNKVKLLLTDPPYNVNYDPSNRPYNKLKRTSNWKLIENDNIDQNTYNTWLENILANLECYIEDGASFYIWNGFRQFGHMVNVLEKLNFYVSSVITWAKPSFAISFADYNQQTEFCLYGWKKGKTAHNWYGSNNETTLWEEARDLNKDYIHPTQKPLSLAKRAIKNSTIMHELVLDTFLGSGSTLIAAEAMNRVCYGMEIDPKYCDAIVKRYINFVGANNINKELEKYINN